MGETATLIGRYVPTKTLRGRKNLPWITQEIRRKMNRRDNLYHIQKTTGKDSHRQLFKKVKYSTPNEDLPYFTLVSVSPPCVSPSHGGFMVTATVNSR